MKVWFFVGDLFEWFESHATVTGVIRVEAELFFAAVDSQDKNGATEVVSCVLDKSFTKLVPVSLSETAAYIAYTMGKTNSPTMPARPEAYLPNRYASGDVALFTGVVWSPAYTELFERLSARGVVFCLFVYDVIPIERPDLISAEYHRIFDAWLRTAVAKARIIFVSSTITKNHILRWAALVGVIVEARIVPVKFGMTEPGSFTSLQDLMSNEKTRFVDTRSFVLSVGTIDARKNQTLLCEVWCRLTAELGERNVPQLVLAGRNDLRSDDWDSETAKAMQSGRIVIVENASDRELAGFYRACLFTVFPSLSEGHGLPVAESIDHGKLCLSSDLPVIREHAGDLARYFDPTDEQSMYDCIRRTIEQPDLRLAAEQAITERYRRTSWDSTFLSIAKQIQAENA